MIIYYSFDVNMGVNNRVKATYAYIADNAWNGVESDDTAGSIGGISDLCQYLCAKDKLRVL